MSDDEGGTWDYIPLIQNVGFGLASRWIRLALTVAFAGYQTAHHAQVCDNGKHPPP